MMKKITKVVITDPAPKPREILELSFSELLDLHFAKNPCKSQEVRFYRWRKWHSSLGDVAAWEMQEGHIEAMVAGLDEAGYSNETINVEVHSITAVFNWAIRARHCPENFINPAKVYRPRSIVPRQIELTDQQERALLSAAKLCNWKSMYPLIKLALSCGGRKSELTGIAWEDIDWTRRTARLHMTKAGKPRELLLTEEMVKLLKKLRAPGVPKDSLVFHSPRNIYKANNFHHSWMQVRENAGLPELRFHDLRHASAAAMLKAGNTQYTVAKVLGHSSTAMLERRYGHIASSALLDCVDKTFGGKS